jgi:CRISPR-associated protein Csh1
MVDGIIEKIGKEKLEQLAVENHIVAKNAVYVILNKKLQYKILTPEKFCENEEYVKMDYYSNLISTNKTVDLKKKISSNNKYTFFCRHLDRLTEKIIDNFFEKTDPEGQNKDFVTWIKQNYNNFEKEKQDYLKIFYTKDIEDCIKDGKEYLKNRALNKTIFKAPEGMGNNIFYAANQKKPYTVRRSLKVDDGLVDKETAYWYVCVYNLLKGIIKQGKNIVYITKGNVYTYNVFKDGPEKMMDAIVLVPGFNNRGEICIYDYEEIAKYTNDLRERGRKGNGILLENYMQIENAELSSVNYYEEITDVRKMERLFNSYFFDGNLMKAYFGDTKDAILTKYKKAYFDYFWKNADRSIEKIIDESTIEEIKKTAMEGETFKGQRQFNLRWSTLEYLNEKQTGKHFEEAYMTLRYHINLKQYDEWEFSGKDEYNIAAGMAVRYLADLGDKMIKNEYYLKGILGAKNAAAVKKKLLEIYKKVDFKIYHVNDGRIQKMLSKIMEDERFEKDNEMILAGYVAQSLIYEKKEGSTNDKI